VLKEAFFQDLGRNFLYKPKDKDPVSVEYCSIPESITTSWKGIRRPPQSLVALLALLNFQAQDGQNARDMNYVQQHVQDFAKFAAEYTKKHNIVKFLPNATSVAETCGFELSPTCAIVGGLLAQQIIQVIGATDKPVLNWFCFSSLEANKPGTIVHLKP